MSEEYKIRLGVDIDTSGIDKQLKNAVVKPIEVDAKLSSQAIDNIKKQLNDIDIGKGLNTKSLDESLKHTANLIENIKNSIGSIGKNNGMKSIVSSVNQISTTVDKASANLVELNAELKKISNQKLMINFDFNLGKGAKSQGQIRQILKSKVMPEVDAQIKELQNLLGGEAKAIMGTMKHGFANFVDLQPQFYSKDITVALDAKDKYIKGMLELAKLNNIDLSGFTSKFSKSTMELMDDAYGVSSAVKEAGQEVPEAIKKMFGGNTEKIELQLDGIKDDLDAIRVSSDAISSGGFENLNISIQKLNNILEELVNNFRIADSVINNSMSMGGSGVSGLTNELKEASVEMTNVGNQAKRLQSSLNKSKSNEEINDINFVKQLTDIDSVIDKQVSDLMKKHGVAGKKGSKAFNEIREAIVRFRTEASKPDSEISDLWDKGIVDPDSIKSVSSAIASNVKVVNEAKKSYKDLLEYIKEVNQSGTKIHLPDEIKQEFGNDFSRMRSRLGKAFTTGDGAIGFDSWLMDLNDKFGNVVDTDKTLPDAFGDLVKIIESAKKGGSYLSKKDLFGFGFLDENELIGDIEKAFFEIDRAEMQMAQRAQQSANEFVQAEEKKQQAIRETSQEMSRQSSEISNSVEQTMENVSAKGINKYFKIDQSVSNGFEHEMENLVKKWTDGKGKLVDLKIDTKTFYDKEASVAITDAKNDAQGLTNALKAMGLSDASIKGVSNELDKLGVSAKKITSSLDKETGSIKLTVTGTNELDQTVKVIQTLDDAASKPVTIRVNTTDAKQEIAEVVNQGLNSGKFTTEINKIESEMNQLSVVSDELKSSFDTLKVAKESMSFANDAGDIDKIVSAQKEYQNALRKTNELLKQEKLVQKDSLKDISNKLTRKGLEIELDNIFEDGTAAAKEFGGVLDTLKVKLKTLDDAELGNFSKEVNNLKKIVNASGLETKSIGTRLKHQFSKFSSYFSVASAFSYGEMAIQDMFQQVVAIDSAMTELKKVTDETDETYSRFLSNASGRAQEIGTTIDGLVESTANFARLGYNFNDSQGLAEVANVYAVVGDEIEGVEGATKSLISTMSAYKSQMGDMSNTDFAMDIVDKFNEVSKQNCLTI